MKIENDVLNRVEEHTARFIENTARVLVLAYQLKKQDYWLWELGDGDETSLQGVLETWMRRFVKCVPMDQIDAAFMTVHSEFEKYYYSREVEDELLG